MAVGQTTAATGALDSRDCALGRGLSMVKIDDLAVHNHDWPRAAVGHVAGHLARQLITHVDMQGGGVQLLAGE